MISKRPFLRLAQRTIVALFAFVCAISNSGAVYALSSTEAYRNQNDILYYGECSGVGSSAGQGINTSGGGGGGCGEQGYSSGKRDSQANKDQIWSFFKSKGLSDTAVAGIMGNISQESAFMPDANNGNNAANQGASGGGCRGIVQWCAGRNNNLDKFAAEKGSDWSCLGTQLEFVWYEVTQTGEAGVMDDLNKATNPGDAGDIWAVKYERMAANEQAGRSDRAEKIYAEYTGTGSSTQSLASTQTSSSGGCTPTGNTDSGSSAPGSLPSGECGELSEKIKQLESSGKLVLQNKAPEEDDIAHCDQVVTCPSGGHIGVSKHVVQVLIAMAEQSGQQVKIFALNKDHFCDQGEHGKGLGMDVSWDSSTPQGQALYKFLYNNAASLGVNKLIYNPPPDGMQCMYDGKPASCNGVYGASTMADHGNHIHVSLFP